MKAYGQRMLFLGKCRTLAIAVLIWGFDSATAEPAKPLMREFIGINGHTVQFKPDLYQPVARLARDYHPVEWDLGDDTSVLPDFPMAKNKVDWNAVYGSWSEKNWTIDACLMFESKKQEEWKDIESDARNYGKAFATAFGPSGRRKLVESVEIGNEPGKWNDTDYARMFKSMASGIRSGDPKLKIATCNVTTGKSGDYEKSVECLAGAEQLFDVLNIHSYAQLEGWPTWRRSFPEDPALPKYLKDVEDLCEWRDKHASGKPVWITEFGYDSTTQPNDTSGTFEKWQGVSDTRQAQWIVRSFLVFSSLPVERAYLYFFNDEDKASLHASAGITRHFKPKPSYHALAHLQEKLGDCRFVKIVKNDIGKLRIQEYADDAGKVVWAVWSPSGEDKETTLVLDNLPGKLTEISRMPLNLDESRSLIFGAENGTLKVTVTESPLYVSFRK